MLIFYTKTKIFKKILDKNKFFCYNLSIENKNGGSIMKALKLVLIVVGILVAYVLCYLAGVWFFKMYDEGWENRACNAGYYDTLPDSMKREGFKCKK